MLRTLLFSALKRANCYVGNQPRFRLFPLYSCTLALTVNIPFYWPWDPGFFEIWVQHHWIAHLDYYSTYAGWMLAFALGLVGLFRPGLIAKGLSLVGLWLTAPVLVPHFLSPFYYLLDRTLWYGFDIPTEFINELAGGNANAATMLWCVYLSVLWVALRPLLRRLFRRVQSLELWILTRWPRMRILDKPVIEP